MSSLAVSVKFALTSDTVRCDPNSPQRVRSASPVEKFRSVEIKVQPEVRPGQIVKVVTLVETLLRLAGFEFDGIVLLIRFLSLNNIPIYSM
jgi:hypothetical protein